MTPTPNPADLGELVQKLHVLSGSLKLTADESETCSDAADALARAEALEKEREQLHLAICGGEDAPGYAASLSTAKVIQVCEENYREWRDDVDGRLKAEAEVAALQAKLDRAAEALGELVKLGEHGTGYVSAAWIEAHEDAKDLHSELTQEGGNV